MILFVPLAEKKTLLKSCYIYRFTTVYFCLATKYLVTQTFSPLFDLI